ncbi:MAG TPA: tail fiber domain-containing protein, partial [Pyrinomonadaceae bacterium]|nr:tail fiber domain-containing protein [Pyrinomonadaceae bacterium]
LGGVAANQYVQTSDPRLTDARPPTAGSTNYIQNQSAAAQAASNFFITGSGTAEGTLSGDILNAKTQLNINGVRAFTVNGLYVNQNFPLGPSNTFAGPGAGINTIPDPNTNIEVGKENSFFGARAGIANVTGYGNSFFGARAGQAHINGFSNSFFGVRAGVSNTSGANNSFFGVSAGFDNTEGRGNTFVGRNAGSLNTTGNNNTALGFLSNVSRDLQYATAIGAEAVVSDSNSIVLGRPGGQDAVRIAGPTSLNGNLVVAGGNLILLQSPVALTSLGTSGGSALCRNGSSQIALCSSSLRYKSNISPFFSGLDLVKRLRPISFDWIDGQPRDLGLGAEEVAAIEPLLVTYNEKGDVEGVKYDRIGVVLVNVVKEQQSQIEALKAQMEEQRAITESLRQLVCAQNPSAAVCSPK